MIASVVTKAPISRTLNEAPGVSGSQEAIALHSGGVMSLITSSGLSHNDLIRILRAMFFIVDES